MKTKTSTNYFVAAITGLTFAVGSIAYAQTPTASDDTHAGMKGHTSQHGSHQGMQNMPSPQAMMQQFMSSMGSGTAQKDGKKSCPLSNVNQDKKS